MEEKTTDELAKILWDYNCLHQEVEKADVIITLGSHDTRVAERGAELFLQGFAPILLFSGGFGRLTDKEWKKPEAETFAEIAVRMGVPQEKILIENKSTNTQQNLEFSMQLLQQRNISVKKVILVHKPYMERRQHATWQKLFPDIPAVITSPSMSFDKYSKNTAITKDEIINIIVGDTQRIKVYPQKGFMIFQEISETVWHAYEELVKIGFTKYLIKNP